MNPESAYLGRTVKIYETDPYVFDFEATVIGAEFSDGYCLIELDRTAFFPEGGGQSADIGKINGIDVLHVSTQGGKILHKISVQIAVGTKVTGTVDGETRFRRMQNHSGEHIFSGLMHSTFGIENVGFHLSADEMTVDTSEPVTEEMLGTVVKKANRAVYENRRITARYPKKSELETLAYRSKVNFDTSSDEPGVRIVEIDGYDACACCAPHVRSTGEIGLIFVKGFIKYKCGSRITLVCGADALEYIEKISNGADHVALALSVRPDGIADAFDAREALLSEKLSEIHDLREKLLDCEISAFSFGSEENVCFFEDGFDTGLLRKLVNAATERTSGICAAFAKSDAGYAYVVSKKGAELSPLAAQMREALGGRGGGKGPMITGFVTADREKIKEFFE